MKHYVCYHNADKMRYPYERADRFTVGTTKAVQHLEKQRVWTITGTGQPRVYHLRDTWVVSHTGQSAQEEFVHFASGTDGVEFDPPVHLNPLPWFAEFLRSQSNFSLGLQPIGERFVEQLEAIRSARGSATVVPTGEQRVTAAELIRFAGALGGQRLLTPDRKAAFAVRVRADGIEVTPESSGEPRVVSGERLARVCERYSHTQSQKPGDYKDDCFHASYVLALVRLYLRPERPAYPAWQAGTPPTDPSARVCRFRRVTDVRAVRIENGSFRGAPVSGVFELFETERAQPVEVQPAGKRLVKVVCAWHGGQPNSGGSGARINLSHPDAVAEVLERYSGLVVDNIGSADDPEPTGGVPPTQPTRVGEPQDADVSAEEGRELLKLHRQRERNPSLSARKKRRVLAETGRLKCEACDFDYEAAYGPLGRGFAECHHRLPLGSVVGVRRTRLSDLAIVCANCHRMLHHRPWHTVEELRVLLQARSKR